MPPKQSATLTEAELRIMDVLWRKGSGTVQQVLDWLVKHVKDGRAHVYEAIIGRKEATRSEIQHLVARFFRNSHEALVLNILQDEEIDADKLKRLREMLERSDVK